MEGDWRPGWSDGRFKVKETTADVGVVGQGKDLPSALASALAGMYWIISPAPAEDRGRRLFVEGEGDDLALAFARALQRLLIAFDTDDLLGASCLAAAYRGDRARVFLEVYGETFDPGRHPQGVEIKGVTHHELLVDPAARAVEVLFDV